MREWALRLVLFRQNRFLLRQPLASPFANRSLRELASEDKSRAGSEDILRVTLVNAGLPSGAASKADAWRRMAERVGFVPGEPAQINDLSQFSIPQITRNAQSLSIRYTTGTRARVRCVLERATPHPRVPIVRLRTPQFIGGHSVDRRPDGSLAYEAPPVGRLATTSEPRGRYQGALTCALTVSG